MRLRSSTFAPWLLASLLVVPGCARGGGGGGEPLPPPTPVVTQSARSAGGMVVAAQPLATRAGASMLEQGGNAVDAAVAAAFALAVVEPSMSGLGGRTQIIIRAPDGEVHGIDATTQAPSTYDPATAPRASYGYAVVGVPGTVAGLTTAHERFGSLPLATVMRPAIDLAAGGFELLPGEAARHAGAVEELRESEGARAYFLKPDGTTHRAGERFVQADLARTLEAVATDGRDAFYRGWIAQRIAEDMAARGGAVTARSLAEYRAEESRVVRGSYRGHELAGLWVPSYGAITVEILHILENLPMADLRGPDWAAAVYQAIDLAYEDRGAQGSWADGERLTSKAHARELAGRIRVEGPPSGAGDVREAGAMASRDAATVGAATASWAPPAWTEDPGHTTHLTTADDDGMVVALTQSLGPAMGSKVAAPGLGFLYAATLGGYLGDMEPGERARSHISPFLVLRDGQPFMGLGAAGGSRIISAIVAAVSRVVDHGSGLSEALRAPRVHPGGDGMLLETETGMGFTDADVAELRRRGFGVEPVPSPASFGRIHAVRWRPAMGIWEGAADPDWEGSAAGPRINR